MALPHSFFASPGVKKLIYGDLLPRLDNHRQ
jgi:hypothetical protein